MPVKVYIGGDRNFAPIPDMVYKRFSELIEKNCTVSVGDSGGLEASVQMYFRRRKYPNVYVYTSCSHPLNNIGGWNSISVESIDFKSSEFISEKDAAMIHESDCAIILWTIFNRETMSALIHTVVQGKLAVTYLPQAAGITVVRKLSQIEWLAAIYGSQAQITCRKLISDIRKLYETDNDI